MNISNVISRLANRILWPARELLYVWGFWSPKTPKAHDEEISQFLAANQPHWKRVGPRTNKTILVEGHLSEYGPNYLFRTALAARSMQEKEGYRIEVVYNGYSWQWVQARKLYSSFGIDDSLCLNSCFALSNAFYFVISLAYAGWRMHAMHSPAEILTMRFGSIKVGDLIYDDIIKVSGQRTITSIDIRVAKAIAKSRYFYLQYRRLFRLRRYEYYISTHTAYSEYGLLCRVALENGVKVLETTDIQMSFYETISDDQLPTYHDGIRRSVCSELARSSGNLLSLREDAKRALEERLESRVKQIDAQKAYLGTVYDRPALKQKLGLADENKIVFILAHVFSDAPHLSSAMLHADYYQWLASTLGVCARSEGVTWIVKPHPSSSLYGEGGMVEEMVARAGSNRILVCPPDLNTKSLGMCADALVTVHGTAGLEYACLGIPVLLAGRPFYSGFGFTIEPESLDAYEAALLGLKDIGQLHESEMNKALEVFAIWNLQFDWHNPIITTEVLSNVWGSGMPRNLGNAYRALAQNLRIANPRDLKLWKFAQSVVD